MFTCYMSRSVRGLGICYVHGSIYLAMLPRVKGVARFDHGPWSGPIEPDEFDKVVR